MSKKNVVIAIVGVRSNRKDSAWRPALALVQDTLAKKVEGLEMIHRFHLLYQKNKRNKNKNKKIAEDLKKDIEKLSSDTVVTLDSISSLDWNYEKVYERLSNYVKKFRFNPNDENYYIHIATGTNTAKTCWTQLISNGTLQAKMIASTNLKDGTNSSHNIISPDIHISKKRKKRNYKRSPEFMRDTYKQQIMMMIEYDPNISKKEIAQKLEWKDASKLSKPPYKEVIEKARKSAKRQANFEKRREYSHRDIDKYEQSQTTLKGRRKIKNKSEWERDD